MVPPYRADQCNHAYLMGGSNWVYCHASHRCIPRGKVMCGRYLGWVGRHKPCVPVVFVRILVPVWDRFATMVAVATFGRHEATQDIAQWGVGRSGQESVMAVGRFCPNAIGPPEWMCEAMGSVVWVQCTNLCRVCVKSIDSRAHG